MKLLETTDIRFAALLEVMDIYPTRVEAVKRPTGEYQVVFAFEDTERFSCLRRFFYAKYLLSLAPLTLIEAYQRNLQLVKPYSPAR